MSTSYFKSRYFPSCPRTPAASPRRTPMEQYDDLATRYQQLTDKYANLREKYSNASNGGSKYSPWSHASSEERVLMAPRYKSPSPVATTKLPTSRHASKGPELYTSRVYRTPPPSSFLDLGPSADVDRESLTSEAIMKKYRSPLIERQVESPRMKSPSILDKEMEILLPRYRQRERMEALLKKEATPPPKPAPTENVYAADGLPPTAPSTYSSPRYDNKYALKYQHHHVDKHRTHASVPKYETFTPLRVSPARKFTCSVKELSHLITEPSGGVYVLPTDAYNEVYPDLFIGDMHTALCTQQLRAIGITHVLNASQKDSRPGQEPGYYVNTTAQYYRRADIEFLGVPATDSLSFDISQYFNDAAAFIDSALRIGGRVLVHCHQGISRSATLVLAFLMMRRGMTAQDAMKTVRARRQIIPNESFLRQLVELNSRLMGDRRNYYTK
ncbi:uncharacterized protein LOC135944630 isoform X1 [Cloeon dipterum]|uniref:uncharacterized protein LOC135944630 isoform X1 n=2 Tax=Cloeon dipterum TaxID=197152 RepID=UPI00321F76DA